MWLRGGQPVTLCNCAGLTSVWAQQAVPTEVCVGAPRQDSTNPTGFAEPGEEESTFTHMCSTAKWDVAQLRSTFL